MPVELMHDERSKIMNSSAFSGGDSAVRLAQQPGNAWASMEVVLFAVAEVTVVLKVGSEGKASAVSMRSLTCMPVNTKRPH